MLDVEAINNINTRQEFKAALRRLLGHEPGDGVVLPGPEIHRALRRIAEERDVHDPPNRRTIWKWFNDLTTLPQRDVQFEITLLACGVSESDLSAWMKALGRAWRRGGPTPKPDPAPDPKPGPEGDQSHATPADTAPDGLDPYNSKSDSGYLGDAKADQRPGRAPVLRPVWLAVALVAVLFIAGGGAAAWWRLDAPAETPPPPQLSVTSSAQPVLAQPGCESGSDGLLFCEDFDGDQLDLGRWQEPSTPARIYQSNGVLNLVMDGDGPDSGVVDHLLPRSLPAFHEIELVVRVLDVQKPGPGGAGLTVIERGGRHQRLVFGGSPGVGIEAEALVCAQGSCGGYDDFTHPGGHVFAAGQAVTMRMVQAGATLTLSIDGREVGRAEVAEPLAGFSIDLDGEGKERWHITIDSIRVRA